MGRSQLLHFVAILGLPFTTANGQDPTGGIAGSVTDPSGATVPRARVDGETQADRAKPASNDYRNRTLHFPLSSRGRL